LLFLFGYIFYRLAIRPIVYVVFLYASNRITEPVILPI
jgi:hypothetical protein